MRVRVRVSAQAGSAAERVSGVRSHNWLLTPHPQIPPSPLSPSHPLTPHLSPSALTLSPSPLSAPFIQHLSFLTPLWLSLCSRLGATGKATALLPSQQIAHASRSRHMHTCTCAYCNMLLTWDMGHWTWTLDMDMDMDVGMDRHGHGHGS